MAESFAIRLQEKMDREGRASPVDMDIVRSVSVITTSAASSGFCLSFTYVVKVQHGCMLL